MGWTGRANGSHGTAGWPNNGTAWGTNGSTGRAGWAKGSPGTAGWANNGAAGGTNGSTGTAGWAKGSPGTETDTEIDKFIEHTMTLYRCMISDIHDSFYVLSSTNLISNTKLHVGRPLLRQFMVTYAEAPLARKKATNEKCRHYFRILIGDKSSVVWNECKNRELLFTGWKTFDSLQND